MDQDLKENNSLQQHRRSQIPVNYNSDEDLFEEIEHELPEQNTVDYTSINENTTDLKKTVLNLRSLHISQNIFDNSFDPDNEKQNTKLHDVYCIEKSRTYLLRNDTSEKIVISDDDGSEEIYHNNTNRLITEIMEDNNETFGFDSSTEIIDVKTGNDFQDQLDSKLDKIKSPKKASKIHKYSSIAYPGCSFQNERKSDHKYKTKIKRRTNKFIDEEAKVNTEDDELIDAIFSSDDDDELNSFVSHTQYLDESNMKAHYLQTVRSPVRSGNRFIFKNINKQEPDINIFSQPVTQVEDTYLYDSFCVKDTEEYVTTEEGATTSTENSSDNDEINYDGTIIHASTRKKHCKRKKQKNRVGNLKGSKIFIKSDSSSEDEIEKLRKELMEQSILFKSKTSY